MTALLLLGLVLPLAIAAMPLVARWRDRALDLLPLAPLPAFAAAVLVPPEARLGLDHLLLGLSLELRGEAALLLAFVAFLWSAAGLYARSYLAGDRRQGSFVGFWCLTLAGNLGVFMAGDVATFYVAFALVSLAAYPLVVHSRTAEAMRAGRVYIALAVLGEFCLFAALVMASSGSGSLAIADVRSGLAQHPDQPVILSLLVVGFGIKAGLVPLHVWLPLAHPVAPTPASAVLSGAIVKAGIFGLMQFLPLGQAPETTAALLVAAGLVTAYYGVLLGLTQRRPKTILAYSTLSQMGLVVALLGSAAAGDSSPGLVLAVAGFYALHHGLAKGALFMVVGVAEAAGGAALRWVMIAAALVALAVAGLPFTGGALAKLALKEAFASGPALVFVTFSAVGTALLLGRFLLQLAQSGEAGEARPPAGRVLPWLLVTVAALVVPWLVFPDGLKLEAVATLAPAKLWDGIWPILAAGAIAALAAAEPGSDLAPPARRIGAAMVAAWRRLPPPRLPEAERALRLVDGGCRLVERAERGLVRWSIAGSVLLALVLVMALVLWT